MIRSFLAKSSRVGERIESPVESLLILARLELMQLRAPVPVDLVIHEELFLVLEVV